MTNSRFEFRAWDKEKKMWTNWKGYDNMFYFMDKNTGIWIRDDKFNRFSLMQHTGLKDKNGVEIYEGDIVEIIEAGGVDEVKWEDGKEYCIGFGLFSCFEYEVIGNIYENQKLLEV